MRALAKAHNAWRRVHGQGFDSAHDLIIEVDRQLQLLAR
jgi:hypothetical protein